MVQNQDPNIGFRLKDSICINLLHKEDKRKSPTKVILDGFNLYTVVNNVNNINRTIVCSPPPLIFPGDGMHPDGANEDQLPVQM